MLVRCLHEACARLLQFASCVAICASYLRESIAPEIVMVARPVCERNSFVLLDLAFYVVCVRSLRERRAREGARHVCDSREGTLREHGPRSRGAEQVEHEQPGERVRHAESLLRSLLLRFRRGELALVEPTVPGQPSLALDPCNSYSDPLSCKGT